MDDVQIKRIKRRWAALSVPDQDDFTASVSPAANLRIG